MSALQRMFEGAVQMLKAFLQQGVVVGAEFELQTFYK